MAVQWEYLFCISEGVKTCVYILKTDQESNVHDERTVKHIFFLVFVALQFLFGF